VAAAEYIAFKHPLNMACVRKVPIWMRIGKACHNFDFKPLDYTALLKGNRPATNSDAAGGIVLFLFKAWVCGSEGVWLCMHGPQRIKSFNQFAAAQNDRSLTPVWGSLDNVIAKGWHSWYTFDGNTWRWKDRCVCYTTAPDSDSDSSD